MRSFLRVLTALLLGLAAGPGAWAQTTDSADLEALYWQRQAEARADFTEADVTFMVGMIGHHAQALVMSRLAPENGANPAVRTLAARIINAQQDEIATMQQWLRDREQIVPEVHIDGLDLTLRIEGEDNAAEHGATDHGTVDHGGMDHSTMDHSAMGHGSMGHGPAHDAMDHASMPGMLSQAQLEELAAARGTAFDRLFLTYMIQHHGGAIVMVDDLFAADGAGQDEASFKLARDIHADQITEIARMHQMLDALPDSE
ncbi:MAG: DUF305 domain-containing protein [Bacteroidota bacterium]